MLNLNKFIRHSISMGDNQPEEIPPRGYTNNTDLAELQKKEITIPGLFVKNVFISISVGTPFCWETFCIFPIPHSRF